MIELREVTKRYGRVTAVERVSFTAPAGTIHGLVGYNGAGKTTLLKTIAGVFRPSEGMVLMNGIEVGRDRRPGRAPFVVADEPYFFSQATPEVLRRFYRGYYPGWSDQVFARLLDLLGLEPKARLNGFSKGMQRQIVLALALASGSSCLLLDESFDGLDLARRNLFKTLFRRYVHERDAVIILSSHNLRELEGVADRVGMIEDRRLIFDLSVRELHVRYRKYRTREEGIMATTAGGSVAGEVNALLAGSPAVRWFHQEKDGFTFVADVSADDLLAKLAALGVPEPAGSSASLEEIFLREEEVVFADLEGIFG